ncbi:MAG TPA: WecB/TagA/CpsF family glycosyltransferase [Candidatus Acidoferrum sp.]|nr:WecB/TagA/CpsF family glycosyltransferase [Candidatus Acidoferrum sp.]
MRYAEKKNVLGVLIAAVDYAGAEEAILTAARDKRPLSVSALAVHGLMTGTLDPQQRYRLNQFDMLVPDGQPVRWALNWLYGVGLRDRVYGPNLTLRVCERAATEQLPVFFYGSTAEILESFAAKLTARFPGLIVAGTEASKFRRLSPIEKEDVAEKIRSSGAAITFVGLGCPRQEVFVYEFSDLLEMPVLAVGAAFPFIAGLTPQAPKRMQDAGLEWLFRLWSEPARLWRRYLLLNPTFLFLLLLQRLGVSAFATEGQQPTKELLFG